MTKPRIGLALGSGSAKGWAHIGVIEALREAGIEPDIVCGTSIGALVGAAYVGGRLQPLREWAEAAKWRDIVGLMDVVLSGGGLLQGNLVVKFLRELGIDAAIESYAKPYAAVATDLASGREIWLQSGPILEAVRASVSLPGILSPARIGEKWLVDGGLTNPVPVSVCRALGADVIIAVNLNGDLLGRRFNTPEPKSKEIVPESDTDVFLDRVLGPLPAAARKQFRQMLPRPSPSGPATPGYFDVLANCINIMQDQITRTRLAGEPPHVLLQPRLTDFALMDFHRASQAIAEGRACVVEALPTLRRQMSRVV